MGKLPPPLRAAGNQGISLLKNPPSVVPPGQFKKSKNKTKAVLITKNPIPLITFKSSSLSDAKSLFNSIISSFASLPDLQFHNSVIQSYSRISTVGDSISLLRHMTKTYPSFIPDRSTYHILLRQSCKSTDSELSNVHRILNLMVTDGFPPDHVSTDIAVRSLCLAGREDHAVEVVKELSSKHSAPDTFTYNLIVKSLCKSSALNIVYNFIDDMRNSFNLRPDLVTYTILIDKVCNSRNLREATHLLGVLGEEGFKPDCFLYNTIMKGYCMLNQGSDIIKVYNKMKEEGVEPDLVTYNTLIFGLSKLGRVKEAKKFLKLMAEKGHSPDAVTYTSLMNGMCRERDVFGALELLEEMELKGCSPNSCTYNTLLHGLSKSKHLDKAMELYAMMKSGDMKLEMASYATFLRALCRAGRIAEAYEVFDYAVDSKSLTDVSAYSTLESTLKWLKKTKEQGC